MRIGPQIVNWTATEAFHPADVVNSRNFDSNLENAEKIGEPMVSMNIRLWEGANLELFYMPFRMDPRLPGTQSRLSFAPSSVDPTRFGLPSALGITEFPVRMGSVHWVDRDGGVANDALSHQWAARLAQTIGDADIAIQVVQHNDRNQPTFVSGIDPTQILAGGLPDALELVPVYGFVTHAGLTYTHVIEDWVLKFEGAFRHFQDIDLNQLPAGRVEQPFGDHAQLAGGLEFGWVYDNDHEATLILEGQAFAWVNGRPTDFEAPFEHDVLIGYRHSFNDIDGTEILVTAITDVVHWPEVLVSASYTQRLSEVWSMKAGLRLVFAPPDGAIPDGLQTLDGDHQATFDLIRYF